MSDREAQNRKIREIWAEIARRTAGTAPEPCPDAEILAAYSAQMLDEDENQRWETHFSVCAACQEKLVALAAAEEKLPVPAVTPPIVPETSAGSKETLQPAITLPRGTWQAPWHWLVPALAAVIVLAVWLGIRKPDFLRPTQVEIAKNAPVLSREIDDEQHANHQKASEQAQAPAPPETQPRAEQKSDLQLQRTNPMIAPLKNSSPNTESVSRAQRAAPKASQKLRAGSAGSAGSLGSADALRTGSPTGSAAKPVEPFFSAAPSTVQPDPRVLAERTPSILAEQKKTQGLGAPARSGEQPGKNSHAEPASPPLQDRQVTPMEAQSTVQIQTPAQPQSDKALDQLNRSNKDDSTAQASGIRAKQQTPRILRATPAPDSAVRLVKQQVGTQVFAPDRKTFWVVGPVGTIERSTDGGASLVMQSSGVLADLLAGSAPSPAVCWVVGSAGTVLLTTDGAHWMRIGAPGDQDWIGVRAMDALHAVIWDKDHQNTFSTSDGGKTWKSMNQ